MTDTFTAEPRVAPCWFRLPPGFIELAHGDIGSLGEQVAEDLAFFGLDDEVRRQRSQHSDALLRLLEGLYGQGTVYLAFGLHANGDDEVSTSVLSLTDIPTNAPTNTLAAAQCGLKLATNPFGTLVRQELVGLPCGAPAVLTTCHLPDTPPELASSSGMPASERVFQARLAVARPTGSRVVLIDISTTTVGLFEEYTEILLGIGQSVSFVDPAPKPSSHLRQSRVWEVLQ